MDYKSIAKQVQDISKETQKHVTEFSWYLTGDTGARSVGWDLLMVSRFDEIMEVLIEISEQLSDVHERLDTLSPGSNHGASPKQIEVEERWGKPISVLLKERKDKSLREIASEFGVGRGTVSNWLKQYGIHAGGRK